MPNNNSLHRRYLIHSKKGAKNDSKRSVDHASVKLSDFYRTARIVKIE